VARIIYKLCHLVEPEYIDHKDRNPRNNQIENLRSATRQENGRNAFHPVGASGFTGVRPKRKRFIANIQGLSGKNIFLGSFATAEEAHTIYREASIRIFGEFSPFHTT
jgi:hypothetical protein